MNDRRTRAVVVVALALTMCASCKAAFAQASNRALPNKTIILYIGFDPGGSYDFYGRLVARYLGRYIPGHPTIVPQNMPGAGSFAAANFLFNSAPRDGSALGVLTEAIAIEEALGERGVQYRAADFNWIGRMTSILEVTYTAPKSAVKTLEDATRVETHMADTGAGSTSEGYPKLLNALAGTRFKLVSGYPGSTQAMMAEAGEVDGGETSWSTLQRSKADWIKHGQAGILVQYALTRSSDLPNVPAFVELGKTDEARRILSFYVSGAEVGRSLVAPPGLPPERIKALRDAFDAMVRDPDFLAEIKKAKAEFRPASGEALQKLVESAADAPPDIKEKTVAILNAGQ